MNRLASCLEFTFPEEGGFSNDLDDQGGATNMGITRATLADWRGHPVTLEDVRDLTKSEATAIYGTKFWMPVRGDDLTPGIDLMLFDYGVNQGPHIAVKQFQLLLGFTGQEVDGWLGPKTLLAMKGGLSSKAAIWVTISDLALAQEARYRTRPTFWKFGNGWLARTARRKAAALLAAGANQ